MISLESISKNYSNKIAKELDLDEEKLLVVNYGLFAFMQISICIISVLVFGLIFNVAIEALIISFTVSILRKSSGGAHASTPRNCAILGTVFSILLSLLCKNVHINLGQTVLMGIFMFCWSFYIVNKLAPVDSINKPIKSLSKKTRLKKGSMLIVGGYLILVIVSLATHYKTRNDIYLVYSLCVYSGLLWQVSSLTRTGHRLLEKVDSLLK